MAERLKDSEDLKLEALFRSEPLEDDGFSSRVVTRVRRRIWVQRLSLPIAFVIGGAIAAKPFLQLVTLVRTVTAQIPQGLTSFSDLPLASTIQGSTIVLGFMLLAVMMMIARVLEE